MSRLKKAEQAGVTYQGSATSVGFNPQQARSTAKADKQRADQIVADGETLKRELQREQTAVTTALTLSQKSESAQLKKENSTESGLFRVNQTIESNNLKMQQKYDVDTLKQEQTFQLNELKMEAGLLKAQGTVDAARTKLIGTAVNGLLSFSGSVVKYGQEQHKINEKKAKVDNAINSTFDIASGQADAQNAAARAQDSQVAADAVTTEDAIQTAIPDPVTQDAVRGGVSASTVQNQARRSSAYVAASDFLTFHSNWVNDLGVTYTRADGSTFTAATVRDAADVTMISNAAKNAFYGAAGLGAMPRDQVATTVVPVVEQTSQSWIQTTNNAILKGNQAERVKSATVSIEEGLRAGDNLETVFRNGFSELYSSGGYIGNKAGANADAVKTILNYAIRNNRPELIDQLEKIAKVSKNGVPQKGTELGIQYEKEFEAAREGVVDEFLSDEKRERQVAENAIVMGERDRQMLLAEAETPEQERQINLEAAAGYKALGTYEGDKKAAELRANPNYSPFTFSDMKQRQDQGLVKWSNAELYSYLTNGEISGAEAKILGYNPSGPSSADQASAERAKTFQSETLAQGNSAVTKALTEGGGEALGPEDKKLILQGQGKGRVNDISDRLQGELTTLLRADPDTSDADIRAFIERRGQEMAKEVTYKDHKLHYTFGGKDIARNTAIDDVVPTLSTPGTKGLSKDFRGYTASDLTKTQNVSLSTDVILNERETTSSIAAILSDRPIPQSVAGKASALGTNAETLLRSQLRILGIEYPTPEKTTGQYSTSTTSYKSSGDLAQYDTGESYGGVSLDLVRNSVIGNESGGNFSAVNPHSGALGYGQIMPDNVPSWSKQALGYEISGRELLRNPGLQMQIINHRYSGMMKDQVAAGYSGDELIRRVAAIWYSGQGSRWNDPTKEFYNGHAYPSVADYTLDILNRYRQG